MARRGRPTKEDYPLTDRIGRVEIRKRTPGSAWQARYSTSLGRQEHSLKLRSRDSAHQEAARIDQLLESGENMRSCRRSEPLPISPSPSS